MPIVYRHRRLDSNEIFYVGIGKSKYRAFEKYNRNKHWNNIINTTEYNVEILYDNLTEDEAKELEIFLIELYGRRCLNNGTLCNLTGGGDGRLDFKHSEEVKLKMSKSNKGISELARKNCLESLRKKVIDTSTGIIYESLISACKSLNYNPTTISQYLTGRRRNKTTIKYL